MPYAAPSRCREPGCPNYATQRGRCNAHYVPWERPSQNTRQLTRTQRRQFHDAVLAAHPVCEWPGCSDPATEADHVIPIADGGAHDPATNGRALCTPHHDHVTRLENARRNRARKAPR